MACLGRTRLSLKKQDTHDRLSGLLEKNMRLQTTVICHVLLESNEMLVNRTPHSRDWKGYEMPVVKFFTQKATPQSIRDETSIFSMGGVPRDNGPDD